MEQDAREQVHRGSIQNTPLFLVLRRGSCCERQITPVSTAGSARLPNGSVVGMGITSHLPVCISPPYAELNADSLLFVHRIWA